MTPIFQGVPLFGVVEAAMESSGSGGGSADCGGGSGESARADAESGAGSGGVGDPYPPQGAEPAATVQPLKKESLTVCKHVHVQMYMYTQTDMSPAHLGAWP